MWRHNQKDTLSVGATIPPSRGRNAPREEGWGSCASATSAPAKPTQDETCLDCTSCAPAGLHTSENIQERKRTREIEREKRTREVLEEKAKQAHDWIKNDQLQKNDRRPYQKWIG